MKSLREGLCSGLPLVIMPFFAEQYRNAMYLVWKNAGVFLDKVQLSSEQVVPPADSIGKSGL